MEFLLTKGKIIHIVKERTGNYATAICDGVVFSDVKKVSRQLTDLEYEGGLKCRRCFSR